MAALVVGGRGPRVSGYDPRMHPLPHAAAALAIVDHVEQARVGVPGVRDGTPTRSVAARDG